MATSASYRPAPQMDRQTRENGQTEGKTDSSNGSSCLCGIIFVYTKPVGNKLRPCKECEPGERRFTQLNKLPHESLLMASHGTTNVRRFSDLAIRKWWNEDFRWKGGSLNVPYCEDLQYLCLVKSRPCFILSTPSTFRECVLKKDRFHFHT